MTVSDEFWECARRRKHEATQTAIRPDLPVEFQTLAREVARRFCESDKPETTADVAVLEIELSEHVHRITREADRALGDPDHRSEIYESIKRQVC